MARAQAECGVLATNAQNVTLGTGNPAPKHANTL